MEELNVKNRILFAVEKAQSQEIIYAPIYTNPNELEGKNEFIFFIKPEITLEDKRIKLSKVIDIILDQIKVFGLKTKQISLLSSRYIKLHSIIAQHYGVINKLCYHAQDMSDSSKLKFKEVYGEDYQNCKVMGGFEFLDNYINFNAITLDYLMQNVTSTKLGGGTYCTKLKIDQETIYLINGFHPRQLMHFRQEGRSIVVFRLVGDLSWKAARQEFVGATNPIVANPKSLRSILYHAQNELGLAEMSQSFNGVHLSAGPVEGLVELVRFTSNFSEIASIQKYTDFTFGKKLTEHFSHDQIVKILSNQEFTINQKVISIFDITEEKDSDEAIRILEELMLVH